MRALRFLLIFLLIVVACGDEAGPVTEIVVYVDADPAVRTRATGLVVTVGGRAAGETSFVDAETIELAPDVLPFQFNFAPRDGDVSREWRVGVRAEDGAGPFAEKTARGAYVPDESRVLYMVLRGPCIEQACPSAQTCEAGVCTSDTATDLPVYEGGRVPPPDMPTPVCSADGMCDDGRYCNGAERCDPAATGAQPNGCVSGDPPCMLPDGCDEDTEMCIPDVCPMPDGDGDGVDSEMCGGDDCDDEDANNFPGNDEVDDDDDNDCDGAVDEGFTECALGPEGTEATCGDGCDNDENGWADCDDFQCNRTEACGYCGDPPRIERIEAACMDGCDNDGNGFADCEDFACDGIGECVGADRPCSCMDTESCLTRRAYGFSGVCGRPCTVGEDAEPSMPGLQIDCPAGQACWWDGRPGTSSGVCAELRSMTPPPPSVGVSCDVDADCASPFGWGRCLTAAETGFANGYCTILDCAAPAAPSTICGSAARCARFDNTSYCLDICTSDSNCRTGYSCVAGIVTDASLCVRECASDDGCGEFGVCDSTPDSTRYCRPPSSF